MTQNRDRVSARPKTWTLAALASDLYRGFRVEPERTVVETKVFPRITLIWMGYAAEVIHRLGSMSTSNRFVSPQISFVSRTFDFLLLLGSVSVDINSLPPTAPSGLTWCFGGPNLRVDAPVGTLGISVRKHWYSLFYCCFGTCG
jgi:hypothetical protein